MTTSNLNPATKPKQPDRRQRPSRSKVQYLGRAPARSDRRAVATCRAYLLTQGMPIDATSPSTACWHEILRLTPADRREASALAMGVLAAEKITPAEVSEEAINDLVETIRHRHRVTDLSMPGAPRSAHEVQRSIRNVFRQLGLVDKG